MDDGFNQVADNREDGGGLAPIVAEDPVVLLNNVFLCNPVRTASSSQPSPLQQNVPSFLQQDVRQLGTSTSRIVTVGLRAFTLTPHP